jgi:hypothetical protein
MILLLRCCCAGPLRLRNVKLCVTHTHMLRLVLLPPPVVLQSASSFCQQCVRLRLIPHLPVWLAHCTLGSLGWTEGEVLLAKKGTNTELGGFIEEADARGIELVMTVSTHASPMGALSESRSHPCCLLKYLQIQLGMNSKRPDNWEGDLIACTYRDLTSRVRCIACGCVLYVVDVPYLSGRVADEMVRPHPRSLPSRQP